VVLKMSGKHYMAQSRIGTVSRKVFWSISEHTKVGTEGFELVQRRGYCGNAFPSSSACFPTKNYVCLDAVRRWALPCSQASVLTFKDVD